MFRDRYVTVKDVADKLGVSLHAVRVYEANGVLPRVMRHPVSHYRLWNRDEVFAACERLQPRQAGPLRWPPGGWPG